MEAAMEQQSSPEKLKRQRLTLEQRKQALEDKQKALRLQIDQQKRKKETKRKILLGSVLDLVLKDVRLGSVWNAVMEAARKMERREQEKEFWTEFDARMVEARKQVEEAQRAADAARRPAILPAAPMKPAAAPAKLTETPVQNRPGS